MTVTDEHRYRITASCLTPPQDLIVVDEQGTKRLYLSATGMLSREPLTRALEAALLTGKLGNRPWKVISEACWLTADELRELALLGMR